MVKELGEKMAIWFSGVPSSSPLDHRNCVLTGILRPGFPPSDTFCILLLEESNLKDGYSSPFILNPSLAPIASL